MPLEIVGKKEKRFALVVDSSNETIAERFPTARHYRDEQLVYLRPVVEVWRELRPWIESGAVIPSRAAYELLGSLEDEYIQHRIAVRRAAGLFKANANTVVSIPCKRSAFDHQARAYGFADQLDASAVFMEQGTGKTYVGIAIAGSRFLSGKIKRVLIGTKKAAVQGWRNQFALDADYEYTIEAHEGKLKFPDPDAPGLHVVVVSHDRISSELKRLLKWKPDMVIVDESQAIQMRRTRRSKAFFALGDKCKHKLIETGTPIGQKPLTIWSQFRFLKPDILGRSFEAFRHRYCKLGGYMGLQVKGYRNLDELAERIHSISFRCTKEECLDLPEKLYRTLYVDMDAECRRIYDSMDLDFIADIGDETIRVSNRISAIQKLRQITGGMVLNDRGELLPVSRKKIKILEDDLEDRDWRHKAVVFTVFDHEMELVLDTGRKLGLRPLSLAGSTKNKGQVWGSFQSNRLNDMIVVQVQTGGTAIELFAATEAYYFSPTFSFFDYAQSGDRLHRIGQRHPVTYSNLIMRNSYDEDVVKILSEAGKTAADLLDTKRTYRLTKSKMR